MSTLCTSSSTSGTVISKVAPRQVLSFLYPIELSKRHGTLANSLPRHRTQQKKVPSTIGIEAWFFGSLSNAAHCHKHKHRSGIPPASTFFTSSLCTSETPKKRRHAILGSFQRQQHTNSAPSVNYEAVEPEQEESLKPRSDTSIGAEEVESDQYTAQAREHLLALVDQYDEIGSYDNLPAYEAPRRYKGPDGPYLTVSDKPEDEWPPPYMAWPRTPEIAATLASLKEALKDAKGDPQIAYEIYRTLPGPRVPYMGANLRHRFLHRIGTVEKKDSRSMLRYMSVVDDMKITAIPLKIAEWNTAMSFAARYVYRATETEVESALHMWREMEHTAGLKGTSCTFNILFDVAAKAGKFTLAEMMYQEMVNRRFEFDRFHRVAWICFQGLKQDGDGVRAAFKDLEKEGDIIDTVVLNALISSFMKCHEASSALQIYNFMRDRADTNPRPPIDFRDRKTLTKFFLRYAVHIKKCPENRIRYQRITPMSPDLRTFQLMFNYFGVAIGDLQQVADCLDDLLTLNFSLAGGHFLALFKSFALYGGHRYTKWSPSLLEGTWTNYKVALADSLARDSKDVEMSMFIVKWILVAFSKCSGKPRADEVWEEIQGFWEPNEQEMYFVSGVLEGIRRDASTSGPGGGPFDIAIF